MSPKSLPPMDCDKFDEVVMDELYDELDDVTHAAVRRHLDGCGRCAGILAGLRATRAVALLPIEEPSDDLEDRIFTAAMAAQRAVPWPKRVLRGVAWAGSHAMRPQLAMAAVLMLILGSSLLLLRAKPGTAGLAPVQVSERGTPAADEGAPAVAAAPAEQGPLPAAEEAARPKSEAEPPAKEAKSKSGDPADVALADARSQVAAAGCGGGVGKLDEVGARYPGTAAAAAAMWEAAACYRKLGEGGKASELYTALRKSDTYGSKADAELAELEAASQNNSGSGKTAVAAPPAAAAPLRAAAEKADSVEAGAAPQASTPAATSTAGGSGGPHKKAAPAPKSVDHAY